MYFTKPIDAARRPGYLVESAVSLAFPFCHYIYHSLYSNSKVFLYNYTCLPTASVPL